MSAQPNPFQMDKREVERFSIDNALRYLLDSTTYGPKVGLENEIGIRALKSGGARHEGGIFIPWAVLARDIGRMQGPNQARDLVVGTPTEGGNLVGTDIKGFVDVLYPFSAVTAAGATVMEGLNGNIAIPQMTAAPQDVQWIAENAAPAESQPGFGQVPMSPKTVSTYVDISRRLLLQSSPDVMEVVKRDSVRRIGVAVDSAAINGTGASNQPRGLRNTSGVGVVTGGTNGAELTLSHLIDLENATAFGSETDRSGAFITNVKVKGKLQRTQHFAGTDGIPLWKSEPERDRCNGRTAFATTLVPDNLTKGSSSGICSAIIYGVWSELVIGTWGSGITVLVDPYTGSTAGIVRLVVMLDCDIAVRLPTRFAMMTDVLTT